MYNENEWNKLFEIGPGIDVLDKSRATNSFQLQF
jgi:hypothetical protein